MGICIHMCISHSVTKEEWKKVYEETLQLVENFPLAEKRKKKCNGIDTTCLVRTKERKETFGWNNEKERFGWCADGDYKTMRTAEEYFLPRDFIKEESIDLEAGDALMDEISNMDYGWNEEKVSHSYHLWGRKTQGEPYHIYLLAIACTIESRLREKALVYGDITRGQCKKAVELANQYLSEPIDIPDRCDMERLWKRISKLSLCEWKQLNAFEHFYLGTKDSEFGHYIKNIYSEDACENYWKNRLKNSRIGTIGFSADIQEYLLWGFDLQKLCSLVNFEDKEESYVSFVKAIMNTKLHQKEKDCNDILQIDQEESRPYSIYTLMAQFAFIGARNDKVDRYIPIDEIREALNYGLRTKCNVDSIIDEYLEKERLQMEKLSKNQKENTDIFAGQSESEIFKQIMDVTSQTIAETEQKYTISEYQDLMNYKIGDTIYPALEEAIKKSYIFYNSLLDEEYYKDLMQQSARECCEWLVNQNRSILIRDKDWEKIFTDIEHNKNSFARYYPMVRVKCDADSLIYLTRALVLNDDLYQYISTSDVLSKLC